MAARLGKEEAARLVLHWVVGGDLVGRLYPDEVSNLDERVARLSDSKCQTRSAGDTPLHLAAKFGGVGMVKLLASMPLTQLASRRDSRGCCRLPLSGDTLALKYYVVGFFHVSILFF